MKILMFFHNGSLNRGCEAIVRSSVPIIKKEIKNSKICLASRNPESDKIIPNIDRIIEHIRKPIKTYSLTNLISVLKIKLFNDESYAFRKIHKDVISEIPNYDIFLSIGGDNYCYGEQPGVYEIDRCIKRAGKKLVLWGASIGKEDLSKPKIEDLKSFDLILARETLTYDLLKTNGLSNVKLCGDSAFLMKTENLPLPDSWQEGNTIGFNYSPLVFAKNKNSKEAALNLVEHILNNTDLTIAFTPHVIQNGNDDHACLLEFYEKFKHTKRVLILPNNLTAPQYKGYISRMRFFIGARTHATIAAYSNLVPTLVLGYSAKSKGIALDLFGEQKLVLNLSEISNTEKLISKFKELLNDEVEIRSILEKQIPKMQDMSKKAAKYLSEIC